MMAFGHEAFRGVDIMAVRPAGWDQQFKEEAQPSFCLPIAVRIAMRKRPSIYQEEILYWNPTMNLDLRLTVSRAT